MMNTEPKVGRLELQEIKEVLRLVMISFSKTFIIIDALDECGLFGASRGVSLLDIFDLQAQAGANLFATSRFLPDIMERFKESLSLAIRALDEDVQLFLERNMCNYHHLSRMTPVCSKISNPR